MRWHKRQPMQYDVTYKKFFDDALIDHLVEQTNPFSVQSTGTSIGVSHNEMEMYFGLLVIKSIIKLPQIRMYWSKETRAPFYNNTKNLPITHKDHDKLYQVRPVIESTSRGVLFRG